MTEPPPEFGPSGYLPDRASKRARKIILRAPLGLQWVIAALVFGVVLLVAGVWWLLASGGPPGPPFDATPVMVEAGAGPTVTAVDDLWIVTGTGPVLAVAGGQVDDLAWCAASRRLESSDGRVWSATGRGLGTPSLSSHPVVVHDGRVHVDRTTRIQGTRPSAEAAAPTC